MSKLDDKIIDIKIKEVEYRIVFTHANSHFLINDNVFGKCDVFNKVIFIDKDYGNYLETVRHEITHAVIFEYGFERTEWDEENVVLFISKYYPIIDEIFNEAVELYDYQTTN